MEAVLTLENLRPREKVEGFAVRQIRDWFEVCDQFMAWQRANLLLTEPSPETLAQHRSALSFLLRFTRLMHCEASDPEFYDKTLAHDFEWRLRKLEDSWTMFHDHSMTTAQANAILQQVFPQ